MALSVEQIREEIKHPSKNNQKALALAQQERIKFHCDTNLDSVLTTPYCKFKLFVESLLPKDKAAITMSLLKFPIPTNEVTEAVFVRLSKIFDGRNSALNYQFYDKRDRDDWEWYRKYALNEPEVWSTTAWEYFKTEINSVMVVDMPLDALEGKPQPYFYFVPIDKVISYSVNRKSGNMDWIIFKSDNRIIAIDDSFYRSFSLDKQGQIIEESLVQNPHELGYCPSRFFWNESLNLANPDVKRSPLSKALSDLDWYLFSLLGGRHFSLYGKFPILSGYEEECDYTDKDGNICYKGHLQGADGHFLTNVDGSLKECPLCHNKRNLAGAGTYVTVPVPTEGQPDLRNPIQLLSVDRKSLEFNVEDIKTQRSNIINTCVGMDSAILQEASLADKQVDATFESQETVLNRVKKGFEAAQQFIDETICRLRYGKGFISATINYGTEFYTLTPEVLQKRYNSAKEGGASETELDALRKQIIETEYRHDPVLMNRMMILTDIEPFRHLSKADVSTLFEKGLISKEMYVLKTNFSGFVSRFERENDNLLEFGVKMPYSAKIEAITEELLKYASESIPVQPIEPQE